MVNLALDWQYARDSSLAPDPVLVNGVVYVAIGNTGSATLYALDANTKNIIWQNAIGATSDPTVANGIVYIGSSAGGFNALNAQTGALIWQYQGDVSSAPVVADGSVYYSAYPTFYARDAKTGALIWASGVDNGGDSQAAVVNGIVYFTAHIGNVDALNARTGALIWQHTGVGTDLRGGPAVFNGRVYVNSNIDLNTAGVFALDALSGAVIWEAKLLPDNFLNNSSPAVANGVVYIVDEGAVQAFDARSGTLLWSQPLNSGYNSTSPVVANGVVYVGSYDNEIVALNAGTGAVLWQYQAVFERNIFGSPIVANGMLFIGSSDLDAGIGVVYAFHLPGQ